LGVGDGPAVARIRPEAAGYAAKHKGAGMSAVMTRTNYRPQSAPTQMSRKSLDPVPGFSAEFVATSLSTVPRVKPEAAENARRAGGNMASVLSQTPPRPQIVVQSVDLKPRPKVTPPSGPIAHDPRQANVAIVQPRIKPEAERTATLGHQGLVGKIFSESFDQARRKNIENSMKEIPKPKNHIHANVNRMRQIQKQAREREKQKKSPVPVKALWRSEKYSSVESRFNCQPATWQGTPTPNAPRPNTAPVRRNQNTQREVNFVAKNAKSAWRSQNRIKRSKSFENIHKAKSEKEKSQQFYDLEIRGTVPEYLVKRKEEIERVKAEKNAKPDPDCPPNHVRLSEEERRRVLDNLKKSLKESENKLTALPVRQCDTLKYKTRKAEIETQIAELDEAIRTFSKKKVYVRQ